MEKALSPGCRVAHYKYGKGEILRVLANGLVEVRFSDSVQYVDQRSVSTGSEKKKRRLEAESRMRISASKRRAERIRQEHEREARQREERKKREQALREKVSELLLAGSYVQADKLFKQKCTDFLDLEEYARMRFEARVIDAFVPVFKTGALVSVDRFYRRVCAGLNFSAEELTILKSPLIRSRLGRLRMKLDGEQEHACAHPARRLLVEARAGSGKTRTLCARAVLSILDESLDPDRVMILAFNTAAAEEVRKRVQTTGKTPAYHNARTFHSLAYQLVKPQARIIQDGEMSAHGNPQARLVRRVMEQIMPVDGNEVFFSFLRAVPEEEQGLGSHLSQREYFQFVRSLRYESLRGDRVKSRGEKIIADFLYEHGINYQYERPSWPRKNSESATVYKPDFTIFSNGRRLVLEHWALDPQDEDATLPAHWETSVSAYRESIRFKRAFWKRENVPLLETHSGMTRYGRQFFEESLKDILERAGIRCVRRPVERLVAEVFKRRGIVPRFSSVFLQFVRRAKKKGWTPERLRSELRSAEVPAAEMRGFLELVADFYEKYQAELSSRNMLDFDDLMQQAVQHLTATGKSARIHLQGGKTIRISELRWILVDEFQDLSEPFYALLDAILKVNPGIRLVAVGDDWQAINAFAGSDLQYFQKFTDFFPGGARVCVSTNYRSHKKIVSAGNQLMDGLGKAARAAVSKAGSVSVHAIDDVHLVSRGYGGSSGAVRHETLYLGPLRDGRIRPDLDIRRARTLKLAAQLIMRDPSRDTLILARTRRIHGAALEDFRAALVRVVDHLGKQAEVPRRGNITVMTAHGAKGSEADRVIVVGCTAGQFPMIHPNSLLLGVFGVDESSLLAEERRLFYVAITRARQELHLLTERGEESPFIDELQTDPEPADQAAECARPPTRVGPMAYQIHKRLSKIG